METIHWILIAALIIILIALIPIVSIWALNTLFVGVIFKVPIELTIYTYLAMLWFGGMLGVGHYSSK